MFYKEYITISDEITISYIDNKAFDKKNLLFVHGWGADKYNLQAIFQYLINDFRIISIDLPGFGESNKPLTTADSKNYADYICKFLEKLNIDKISYVGHSFGGKIGIILAATKNIIEKLILIDSAGIRAKRGLDWYIKVYSYKLAKLIIGKIYGKNKIEMLQKFFGSSDYKQAGNMRDILVKVTQEDYTTLLKDIKCPTFIFWGEKDKDTPIWMAKKMKRLISDSALYIIKNADHFSFLYDNKISDIIKAFLNEK